MKSTKTVRRVVILAFLINLMTYWCLLFSLQYWAVATPSPSRPYLLRLLGGSQYYVPKPLGLYVDSGIFIAVGLLAIVLLVFRRYPRAH